MKQQAYYSNYSATTELSIAAYRRKAAFISTFRLLCIGVLAIGIYAFWAQYLLLPIIALGLGLFIWLVKIHAKTKDKLQFLKNLLHLLRDEEHLANGAWRTRPSGSAYQEKGHPFAADLNYFGAKGIYSYLNRSQSEWAGEILATWLKNPLYDKEEILAEQERFKNLAAKPDFMFEYLAEMALSPVDLSDKRALIDQGNFKEALPYYERIRDDFPKSNEARVIDSYIARVGG